MNRISKSLALGVAFAALAFSAAASERANAPDEMGCPASAYRDSADSEGVGSDGLRYWQRDTLRVSDAGAIGTPRTGLSRSPGYAPATDGVALARISSRVERLGQGIAATPLLRGFIADPVIRTDNAGEPNLSMLLLAAAGVVLFVARRRRID